jgi:hypothetical protein
MSVTLEVRVMCVVGDLFSIVEWLVWRTLIHVCCIITEDSGETCFIRRFLYGCRHKYFELSSLVCISCCDPKKCINKAIAILPVGWNLLKLFFTIKQTRCINFSNLFLDLNFTCFGQFLRPSSGVFHYTAVVYTYVIQVCWQLQAGSCSQAVSKPV